MALYAGIDVGSRTTKALLLNDEGEIVSYHVLFTGADPKGASSRCLEECLRKIGKGMKDLEVIISTGYGRKLVSFATKDYTEITCHARGAGFYFPQLRMVIDIGGQDSKVIALEDGMVLDFVMNDKCAAGTGRFLEVMAQTLEMSLEELAQEASRAKHAVPITSMCTVFAESEVISLIAEGISRDRIVWGLHLAIAKRIASMVKRLPQGRPIVFTGGVAKNKGMVRALEEVLGEKLLIPPDPQLVGALGAALLARDLEDEGNRLNRHRTD
jgi:predicted CoA-substrate-specific enzyme activase